MLRGLLHWAWTIIRAPYTIYEGWRDAWATSTMCDVCLGEGEPGTATAYCKGCFGMACERHQQDIEEGAIRSCCEVVAFARI